MAAYTITLDCDHVIQLGGRLPERLTHPGRVVYCGNCRTNRRLTVYAKTETDPAIVGIETTTPPKERG